MSEIPPGSLLYNLVSKIVQLSKRKSPAMIEVRHAGMCTILSVASKCCDREDLRVFFTKRFICNLFLFYFGITSSSSAQEVSSDTNNQNIIKCGELLKELRSTI